MLVMTIEPRSRLRTRVGGAALVLVLWFVAALSLIAVSVASSTRADTRAASLHVSMIRAAAAGDAAINLALLDADAEPVLLERLMTERYEFDGHVVTVTLRPDTGLINLNVAPLELLRDLFVVLGEVDPARAESLARGVMDWRNVDEVGAVASAYASAGALFVPRHGRFEAPEDLLQVLGVDLGLYARIRRSISVHGNSAGVNPGFAPLEVLRVVAAGRDELAQGIHDAYRRGDVGIDTSLLQQVHLASGSGSHWRAEANLEIDGVRFSRIRWVTQAGGATSMPWALVSAETLVDLDVVSPLSQ